MTTQELNNPMLMKKRSGILQVTALGVLFSFNIYIILGNIPRFVTLPGFGDNLVLTEVFLYATTLVFLLTGFRSIGLRVFSKTFPFLVILLINLLIGLLINGAQLKPILFNIRLGFLFLSGYSIAAAIIFLGQKSKNSFENIYYRLSLVAFMISVVIFVIFPNSPDLWNYLAQHGIDYVGDPHQGRLISVYFDPNYYAVILTFIFLVGQNLYYKNRNSWYLLLNLCLLAALVFTESRSGMATFLLYLSLNVLRGVVLQNASFKVREFLYLFLFSIILLLTSPLYGERLGATVDRAFSILQGDISAQDRLSSFQLGNEIFVTSPIIGIGYNYLSIYTEEARRDAFSEFGQVRSLTSVDSSLQATLISFGLIGFGAFLIVIFLKWWKLQIQIRNLPVSHPLRHLFNALNVYVLVTVLFASQFNNVLYYQFWLIPVIACYAYVSLSVQRLLYVADHNS